VGELHISRWRSVHLSAIGWRNSIHWVTHQDLFAGREEPLIFLIIARQITAKAATSSEAIRKEAAIGRSLRGEIEGGDIATLARQACIAWGLVGLALCRVAIQDIKATRHLRARLMRARRVFV
jgi:hypothetical protein